MKISHIEKISYDPKSKGYLVEVCTKKENKILKIIVSTKDAKQISLAKEGVILPRPSTHDLLLDLINVFDIKLKKVIISDFKLSTFYAKIVFYSHRAGEFVIDSRPSDAMVLSLKSNCPIYISNDIFSKIVSNKVNIDSSSNEPNVEKLLSKLSISLNEAISSEEYETAAKIRDKINVRLQSKAR